MTNKLIAWVCLAALLVGGALGLRKYWGVPLPDDQTRQTGQLSEEMKDTLATVTARIRAQDEKTRTEVRVIHETVRTRVNVLPADAVADGLNSELAVWRGVEVNASGLDGD